MVSWVSMTLTTHAVVGVAAAQLFPEHVVLAFSAAFVSHLALDTIPHWDYHPRSQKKYPDRPLENDMEIGKDFLRDLLFLGSDAMFGLLLSAVLFSVVLFSIPLTLVLVGTVGGLLPDALQFVYYKTRSRILYPLQWLHQRIQKGKSLHVSAFLGLSYQALLVALILLVEKITLSS